MCRTGRSSDLKIGIRVSVCRRSAAARHCSFLGGNGNRVAVRTIGVYHYRRNRVHSSSRSQSATDGILRVDDELHLTPLAALEEDPKLAKLRAALDKRVGEAQLPFESGPLRAVMEDLWLTWAKRLHGIASTGIHTAATLRARKRASLYFRLAGV